MAGTTTEPSQTPSETLSATIYQCLAVLEQTEGSSGHVIAKPHSAKVVSPWLQLTLWSRYLEGHRMLNLVALAAQPHRTSEPVLTTLCQSLDRLVQNAYESVCEDRINVFDQTRIKSFLQSGRPSDRPLMVTLRKAIWRKILEYGRQRYAKHIVLAAQAVL